MPSTADVCVLLPTLDEAATIGEVIDAYTARGFANILVVDGNSDDDTREIAAQHGADVITQTGTGKGQAVREAVDRIDAEYILMVDADATYSAEDAEKMLEPLVVGGFEHVIGNRFADMRAGAMTSVNRVGNRLINRAFAVVHGENYRDILSGYRAFTRRSFERLTITADGFGIETQMAVECAKKNVKTDVVPITYKPRPDGSATNLHPLKDGGIIFLELYRKAKTNNPLFYFGSVGLLSTGTGLLLASYVLYRWFTAQIGHEIIALGSAAAILFGVQLLMFGVLSDLILSLHREQLARIQHLEEDNQRRIDRLSGDLSPVSAPKDGSEYADTTADERPKAAAERRR
ncbi:S-layer glycoprotein N-glycosyltransferase AglJ [Haloferacaceae archaeon DSL9]